MTVAVAVAVRERGDGKCKGRDDESNRRSMGFDMSMSTVRVGSSRPPHLPAQNDTSRFSYSYWFQHSGPHLFWPILSFQARVEGVGDMGWRIWYFFLCESNVLKSKRVRRRTAKSKSPTMIVGAQIG